MPAWAGHACSLYVEFTFHDALRDSADFFHATHWERKHLACHERTARTQVARKCMPL